MYKIKKVLTNKILWILLSLACIVRLYIWYLMPVFNKDGISFINTAMLFAQGNFYEGLKHPYHPLYPLFISLISITGLGYEISGRFISLFFGMLSVLTLYAFGKKLFDQKIAFLSAILLVFHPYAARLSANVMSDSTYLFFFLLGFGLGYLAITSKKSCLFFLTGIVSAFAYLTRPEGISIIVIISLCVIVQLARGSIYLGKKEGLKNVSLLLIGFLIFASPYMVYLKKYTGSWVLTQKKKITEVSGIDSMLNLSKELHQQKRKMDELPDATGKEFLGDKTIKKTTEDIRNSLRRQDRYISKTRYLSALYHIFDQFIASLHYPLLVFLVVGIRGTLKTRQNKGVNLYISSYIILFMLILFFLKVSSGYAGYRHFMSIVLIVLLWTGIGMNNVYLWLVKKVPQLRYLTSEDIFSKAGIVFLCLVIAMLLPKTLKSLRMDIVYKDAGIWIKTFYPDIPTILTDESRIAFYANVNRLKIPKKISNCDEIVKYAKEEKINLIVVTEDIVDFDPDFFLKINQNPNVKELLNLSAKERRASIYQVLH